ncbi:MAG: AAA family ATPase [Lachnospiraceae bacterium]|nr:AAA family ATPase [Lachnospiraceae bacterium]
MKLVSCHIENFGKLCNQDFQFSDGLNIWIQKNGWGKSTLAAFLKVMFFEFENERKRTTLEKEREKYRPWQGGIYGGNVVFQVGKKTYRMERTFGEKEKEDRFWLYDESTGLGSEDYTEEVGRELFGIDSFSFQKSIYIVQNQCKMETTDAIHAKLGNPMENAWDLENYTMAQKALAKEIHRLQPNRKNGELAGIEAEIEQLSYGIIQLNRSLEREDILEQGLLEKEQKLELLQTKQQELEKEQYYNIGEENSRMLREHYEDICKRYKEKEEKLEELEGYFMNGIPKEEEVREVLELAEEEFRNQIILDQVSLSQEEEQTLQWIREHWNNMYPKEEDLAKCKQWIKESKNQENKEQGNAIFTNTKKKVAFLSEEECKQICHIGIICIILGVLLLVITRIGGIVLIAIGILCLILGIRRDKEQELGNKKEKPLNKERKKDMDYTKNLTKFLNQYPIPEKKEWSAHLEKIESMILIARQGQAKKKRLESALKSLYSVTEKIEGFFTKYGMHKEENTNIQLQKLLVNLESYRLAEGAFSEIAEEKEKFSSEYFMDLLLEEEEVSTEREMEWQKTIEAVEQLSVSIQEDTEQLEVMEEQKKQIEEYQNRLEILKIEKAEKEKQLNILKKTSEYLQMAKESFGAKYRTPMEKGVEKYVRYLTGEDISFHIDANLELKKREKGALRNLTYYSQGWQDLFGICMRLALVDAMYPLEKPFLILDDPFVNMDESKTKGGMHLLESAAKEYQILYFTCHESRGRNKDFCL